MENKKKPKPSILLFKKASKVEWNTVMRRMMNDIVNMFLYFSTKVLFMFPHLINILIQVWTTVASFS